MAPAATEYEPPSTSTSDVTIIIHPVRALSTIAHQPPDPAARSSTHPHTVVGAVASRAQALSVVYANRYGGSY